MPSDLLTNMERGTAGVLAEKDNKKGRAVKPCLLIQKWV
jgi:hypothetical protein